ncbi:MAG: hypothetical protein OXF25_03715 [Cyanobacteria bacterium MAG CAR3_bin_5]|nr:hypothetical protein [Cyanobacteria bacterium MAG CAR3_bin_5]
MEQVVGLRDRQQPPPGDRLRLLLLPQPPTPTAEGPEQGVVAVLLPWTGRFALDGSVTTTLVGADWRTVRWQAGAALAPSRDNGSYTEQASGPHSSNLSRE